MQTLEIKNFGPIDHVKIDLTEVMIFIGPQTSGKSTIAKNIYYFTSFKDYLLETIEEVMNSHNGDAGLSVEELWRMFHSNLRMKFTGFWGISGHKPDFKLSFTYGENLAAEVYLDHGKITHHFSAPLISGIDKVFTYLIEFLDHGANIISEPGVEFDVYTGKNARYAFLQRISGEIRRAFISSKSSLFLPANRSLITTLPDYLINLILRSSLDRQSSVDALNDPFLIDLPTRQFINLVSFVKTRFTKGLDEIISEKLNLDPGSLDPIELEPFLELIPEILKGKYLYESGSEKLYFPESDEFVSINLASSGQQESIWILLNLFRLALNKISSLVIIEEPETHLYTDSQVLLVNLLAYFCKINDNHLVVTTHSPYVLSAFNNLMFAQEVGTRHAGEISKIISEKFWLDQKNVSALFVENGKVENILEPDLNQIAVERIDNASRVINRQYDQMLEHFDG